ncbi:hypothetical protein LKL35_26360 [Streptomyces sp. ET3-23]|uniref:hypothetical protein n=1 Tax=Streptomyces sp. ET3-23 TaxID=2885643 RepID=UPI001D0FF277|nr:hypothetical protein [Streptomyces sp. ET3-23]MCC2278924.1 hypothetical protein [Streptomyces sp. ET3-23]
MSQNQGVSAELARIVADIEKLYADQRKALVKRWGEDCDVPTEDLPEYDEITYEQLAEDAELLGSVRRRLASLLEPAAA